MYDHDEQRLLLGAIHHFPNLISNMALFGMVWLLRVRAEMRRCTRCRREQLQNLQRQNAASPIPGKIMLPTQEINVCELEHKIKSNMSNPEETDNTSEDVHSGPNTEGTYCEVHGYVPLKPGKRIKSHFELCLQIHLLFYPLFSFYC